MRLRLVLTCLALFVCSAGVANTAPEPASLVDPFVGTSGTKIGGPIDTFPGADSPFGMVQFSPDTPTVPAGGGYDYKDSAITGFSLDHLSGPGCNVFGDFGVLPVIGTQTDPAHAKQPFSHSDESASAGYYAVTLGREGIRAQLTAGPRSGIASFTFPESKDAEILINAASDEAGVNDSAIRVVSPTQIEGWATSGQFCGMPNTYTVYFAAQFDRPAIASDVWGGGRGAQDGARARFNTTSQRTVIARFALSFASQAGAWTNLRAGTADFDTQRAQTATLWNQYLGRVRITGGTTEQQKTFYTALYHALLHPNLFSDADGHYRGFDNALHSVRPGHAEYANFSGWDIYRTQMPLVALIAPRETSDMMQSLLDAQHQGGWLPKWPVANAYSSVMGGDPAETILAEAYAFGARDFDPHAALSAMIKNAQDDTSAPGQGWYRPRPGVQEYLSRGYVVNTHTTNVSPVPNGASLTLEYSAADFSVAQFAKSIGNMSVYRSFMARSERWRNLFDTSTGLMTPRDPAGAFMRTPIVSSGQSGFQEGNAYQYTWMVPYDLSSLIYGIGGRNAAVARLDAYFAQLNAGPDKPYAWLGNEPSLGDPWVYWTAGAPSKGEYILRQALTTLYGDTPDGNPGNDDLGTMSAWYVWCAMGLYPQTPSIAFFDLGAPLFTSVRVSVPGGARISLDAPAAGDRGEYVRSVTVNGKAQGATWVAFSYKHPLRVAFDLSDASQAWGTALKDAPPSFPASMPRFPSSTSAQFASGDRSVTIEPGGNATIGVTLNDGDRAHPATVSWRVNLPPGISASPDSGVTSANTTLHIQLRADSSIAPHYYPLTISARAAGGAILEPWSVVAMTAPHDSVIPLAYVANFSDNTVDAFDPQTGAIVRSLPVGSNPGDVALTPDAFRLLVPNQGSNNLTVIDTVTGRTLATIKTGKVPASVRIAPNGATAWVTDYGEGAVQVIDLKKMTAGPLIPVGRNPQGLAFSPNGTMVYVANQGDNDVTPIEVRTRMALYPIPVGARPMDIVVAKDGSTAYVSNSGDATVTPIDLRTRTPHTSIAVGVEPQGMALDETGSKLYVADSGSDTVSVVDTARGVQTHVLRAGLNPQTVSISSDGAELFVTAMSDNACVKIPIADPTAISQILVGNVPLALALP